MVAPNPHEHTAKASWLAWRWLVAAVVLVAFQVVSVMLFE